MMFEVVYVRREVEQHFLVKNDAGCVSFYLKISDLVAVALEERRRTYLVLLAACTLF